MQVARGMLLFQSWMRTICAHPDFVAVRLHILEDLHRFLLTCSSIHVKAIVILFVKALVPLRLGKHANA